MLARGIRVPYNMNRLIAGYGINTVCILAMCPNKSECWSNKSVAVQILGSVCTRHCRFCSEPVAKQPPPPDYTEIERIASFVEESDIRFLTITSPARDDLDDMVVGDFFARIIKRLSIPVEVLVPQLELNAIKVIVDASPYIFSHNIETVKRLTPVLRDRATYEKTLEILSFASKYLKNVKSSIMLGAGEEIDEVKETIIDLKNSGVNKLVIGQYLPPTDKNLPLVKLYRLEEFSLLKEFAVSAGIEYVYSHPYARTSYYKVDSLKFYENTTL